MESISFDHKRKIANSNYLLFFKNSAVKNQDLSDRDKLINNIRLCKNYTKVTRSCGCSTQWMQYVMDAVE